MVSLNEAVLAVTLMAAIASPVQAADRATLGCVAQRLSATEREAIIHSAQRMADDAQETIPAGSKAAVHLAAIGCAKRHHWTAAATDAAKSYTFAALAQRPIDDAIRATGNDPALWTATFQALPEVTRTGIVLGKDDAVTAYTGALTTSGAVLRDTAGLHLAGVLAALLVMREQSQAHFTGG